MTDKAKKLVAAIAALAALAVGGAALAQAGDTPAQSQPGAEASEATAPENSAADKDDVQDENGKDDATEEGEKREAPEATAPENSAADKDDVQDENGKDDATEEGEKREAPEGNEGKEVSGDDGPGGHADESANPNADHQGQGEE